MLYWYKSTNTDTCPLAGPPVLIIGAGQHTSFVLLSSGKLFAFGKNTGTQFTCFTGTKVQILATPVTFVLLSPGKLFAFGLTSKKVLALLVPKYKY